MATYDETKEPQENFLEAAKARVAELNLSLFWAASYMGNLYDGDLNAEGYFTDGGYKRERKDAKKIFKDLKFWEEIVATLTEEEN